MTLAYAILFFTWAFIALAWFFPGLLRIAGALLYSAADASEAMREWFGFYRVNGISPQKCRRPPASEGERATNPNSPDVIQALISQGEPRKKAEQRVAKAAAELPQGAGFDELWRKAVAA